MIIAGFGRYGQIVGRLLFANGFKPTVLEHDAEQVEGVRRFGWPVFYGDATPAGPAAHRRRREGARSGCWPSTTSSRASKWPGWRGEHFPQMTVVARARNVTHYYELRNLGVELIERETPWTRR